jgi:hypothetical protein
MAINPIGRPTCQIQTEQAGLIWATKEATNMCNGPFGFGQGGKIPDQPKDCQLLENVLSNNRTKQVSSKIIPAADRGSL